jgi:hypothetical protein
MLPPQSPVDNLPPVVGFGRQGSALLEQLPFQNEDADLFSFLDGLGENFASTSAPDLSSRTEAYSAVGIKAAGLNQAPSWLPDATDAALDANAVSINMQNSMGKTANTQQVYSVPAPQFPLEPEAMSVPETFNYSMAGLQDSSGNPNQPLSSSLGLSSAGMLPGKSNMWTGNSNLGEPPATLWASLSQPPLSFPQASPLVPVTVPDPLISFPSLPKGAPSLCMARGGRPPPLDAMPILISAIS